MDSKDSRHSEKLTLIKVGTPTTSAITIPIPGTVAPTPITLTSIEVNTSCFCHPTIRIDFCCNIVIPVGLTTTTLTFQVFKRYNHHDQTIAIGAPWVYTRSLGVTEASADIISFFIEDNLDSFMQCGATYIVAVTPTVSATNGTVAINNATVSALVSGDLREGPSGKF